MYKGLSQTMLLNILVEVYLLVANMDVQLIARLGACSPHATIVAI